MPFALSPYFARSALAPFSIAVTVIAIVPDLVVPYLNGTTARSPSLSSVPGFVTSPAGTAAPVEASGEADAESDAGALVGTAGEAWPDSPPHADSRRPAAQAASRAVVRTCFMDLLGKPAGRVPGGRSRAPRPPQDSRGGRERCALAAPSAGS